MANQGKTEASKGGEKKESRYEIAKESSPFMDVESTSEKSRLIPQSEEGESSDEERSETEDELEESSHLDISPHSGPATAGGVCFAIKLMTVLWTHPHPGTSWDWQALMHIFKAFVGTGVLGLPSAVTHGGIVVGSAMLLGMGIICMHNIKLLVFCGSTICSRLNLKYVKYGEITEELFSVYGEHWGKLARFITDTFLCTLQIGFCCVYVVFITQNLQKVTGQLDLRVWMIILFPMLFIPAVIRNMRKLAYMTAVANVVILFGLLVIYQYLMRNTMNPFKLPPANGFQNFLVGFGQIVYAFEGIAVVLPTQNKMKRKEDFPWVLRVVASIVIVLYLSMGILGYITFGDDTKGSITLNLPKTPLYAVLQSFFALAVYLTYPLQLFVSVEIIRPIIEDRLPPKLWVTGEYLIRAALVTITCIFAITIPQLDNFMALVGSLCGAFVAIVLPPVLHTLCYWNEGLTRQEFYLNVVIALIGLLGGAAGTFGSVVAIIQTFQDHPNVTKPS